MEHVWTKNQLLKTLLYFFSLDFLEIIGDDKQAD